jgi:glycosyltransferase involved in cell wall biosynthesis
VIINVDDHHGGRCRRVCSHGFVSVDGGSDVHVTTDDIRSRRVRILVVSAHYPPNFISGGTLGPQRLARGLREAGHYVSIYAGWIGDREPLATWDDVDETGIPIRWIVVTPWTHWWERRNFDNPDVAVDFKLHLDDVKPDLVHVHALQTLGRGVIDACVEANIRVVVTMHDFWWICGRQFLSNRAQQLCSAVVSCGMCHCEVNREWLEERNANLLETLSRVDAILAVSESEAEILRANGIGIDPDGPPVIVDENGLPPLPERGRRRLDGDRTVFLYTGGGEVLKGARIVLDAARLLRDLDGWTLETHGMADFLRVFDITTPDRVVVRPRFAPDEADDVFDRADVLILPSVVRESHSLVTREALSRGMPVITSDTVGPEEVVNDRENGLIVPAGDARALATAMRAIVTDRTLRDKLANGARAGVHIRSLESQIVELDERLRSIASDPGRGRTTRERRRRIERVLFVAGIEGAPLRYRAQFAAEALALHGVKAEVRHYRSPEVAALAALADAVIIYRVPATHQVLALIDGTKRIGTPVFFDVDDLIFEPDVAASIPAVIALPDDVRELYFQGVRRYRTTMEACDAYVGSTAMLVDHAAAVVGIPSHRWWNGVGIGPARCSDAALANPRTPGPLRIGYMSGTSTHEADWQFVEPAVLDVLRRRRDVELWLGGLVSPTDALAAVGDRVKRIPLKPWWELPWVLRDLDVNLAPLEPGSRFNEAKSAVKWLEAALAETVTVASPSAPFAEVIADGRNGRLASSREEFSVAIDELLDDELTRTRIGRVARREALLRWSPHLQGRRYLDILENGDVGRVKPSSWTDHEALDEPWDDIRLEDYIVPDPMVLAPINSLPIAATGDLDAPQRREVGRVARLARSVLTGIRR